MPIDRVNASSPWWPRRGLYAITPEQPVTVQLEQTAAAVLRGGAVMLQYRSKHTDASLRLEQARALRTLCAHHGVPFIINDDIELAIAVRADGVHLGVNDVSIAQARQRLGSTAILGATCHTDLALARHASAAGADYLAFGAFHRSSSKPEARPANPAVLTAAAEFNLPRVAIGGIRVDNAGPLLAAGADLLAVIGALFEAPDPQRCAAEFAQLFSTRQDHLK
jgi:thiamine-phosphate pyrophosphorylase